MEVDEKGKRRFSWDSTNLTSVARACTKLGKCKLGLGPNKLVAQQIVNNSNLGLSTTSPKTL